MFEEDTFSSEKITSLLAAEGFTQFEMSLAIIDVTNKVPKVFGYNMDHFIYPASIYKIFIAAEVLRRIEARELHFEQEIKIKAPNDVDKDARIFPGDTRKILHAADVVTIEYLLDLMLTRSDNTASNTLIDLVGRENITKNIIYRYNWHGSEVTRKFLDKIKEDKPYQFSSTTLTCSRHLTEFFYLVENEKLISPFVSKKLKEYMLRFNPEHKKLLWLQKEYVEYYCKGGFLETNLYKHKLTSLFKAIFKKRWAVIRYENDAGVVTGPNSKYAISILTVHKSIFPWKKFDLQRCAKVIFDFMENEKPQ